MIIAHYALTIILGIFIAILIQRPHWMLTYVLMFMLQTVTLCIMAMVMYPTNWMSEETYKLEHDRYVTAVGMMRGRIGDTEVLIPPPQ